MVVGCPIASAAVKPSIFSAPRFQLRMLRSVERLTIASSEDSTIAASRACWISFCRCVPISRPNASTRSTAPVSESNGIANTSSWSGLPFTVLKFSSKRCVSRRSSPAVVSRAWCSSSVLSEKKFFPTSSPEPASNSFSAALFAFSTVPSGANIAAGSGRRSTLTGSARARFACEAWLPGISRGGRYPGCPGHDGSSVFRGDPAASLLMGNASEPESAGQPQLVAGCTILSGKLKIVLGDEVDRFVPDLDCLAEQRTETEDATSVRAKYRAASVVGSCLLQGVAGHACDQAIRKMLRESKISMELVATGIVSRRILSIDRIANED